jgi:NDP-sugar pyrophosphorylase family protein
LLRLLSLARPKVLFPLADVPLIDYVLRGLRWGVDAVVMAVNSLAEVITGYLGGERFGLEIVFVVEGGGVLAWVAVGGGLQISLLSDGLDRYY